MAKYWDECENCGGEGVTSHDCGEDSCCCEDPEDTVQCECCGGRGGFEREADAPGREMLRQTHWP
jgi:hypothetical protein